MITIHIRRYRAKIHILNDKVMEESQQSISSYTETKDTTNVSDMPSFRQQFIEEMGKKIYNQNRLAELKAVRERASSIEKVVIYNIT